MYKKIIIVLSVFISSLNIQAQNNAIFFGGSGDGFASANYASSTPNINLGGDGDGFASFSYLPLSQNVFLGGDGDGFSSISYLTTTDEALFFGGDGDGWAGFILPLTVLPIELLSFTGYTQENNHHLNWSTLTEENSSHFVLEHSTNAKQFLELGMINAAGNSLTERNYSFINEKPVVGNNFYRLKMIDIDKKYKYSNVILLKMSADKSSIIVYPNPTASMLNVSIESNNTKDAFVKLFDMQGKIVFQQSYPSTQQTFSIDLNSFAVGIYQLRIEKGSELNSIKIQKK